MSDFTEAYYIVVPNAVVSTAKQIFTDIGLHPDNFDSYPLSNNGRGQPNAWGCMGIALTISQAEKLTALLMDKGKKPPEYGNADDLPALTKTRGVAVKTAIDATGFIAVANRLDKRQLAKTQTIKAKKDGITLVQISQVNDILDELGLVRILPQDDDLPSDGKQAQVLEQGR